LSTFWEIGRYVELRENEDSCKNLESMGKWSFRVGEARSGIKDFQAVLVSGFGRKDGIRDF
jgi:hypothetical protein